MTAKIRNPAAVAAGRKQSAAEVIKKWKAARSQRQEVVEGGSQQPAAKS